jgi:hypothetical protein
MKRAFPVMEFGDMHLKTEQLRRIKTERPSKPSIVN